MPGELNINPLVENISGTYDILFTFSTSGQGNFFEFSFVGEELTETEDGKACDNITKFSNADFRKIPYRS